MNICFSEGGLYAERIGAHLPGFPDLAWSNGSPLASAGGGLTAPGVNFYRTKFSLGLPSHTDVPIRLSITPSDITSNFRIQIYLNGWMLGKYINNFGYVSNDYVSKLSLNKRSPQTDFVLPAGYGRLMNQLHACSNAYSWIQITPTERREHVGNIFVGARYNGRLHHRLVPHLRWHFRDKLGP
jgi:hypothetical protein